MLSSEVSQADKVSIHAPREGCDVSTSNAVALWMVFQFTHPGRGATADRQHQTTKTKFQFTHPGRGATAASHLSPIWAIMFQFTHPGRGATQRYIGRPYSERFQFTHPGRGATDGVLASVAERSRFNSRTPGGVRHHFETI